MRISDRSGLPRAALASLILSAAMSLPALSQSVDTKLLRGKAVTESNVLEALTPAPAEERVVTRSLRVSKDPAVAEVLAPQRRPSASLLITFETNSAVLTQRAKEQLDVVAAALKNDKLKDFGFEVEGHADPRGTEEGNMTLSQRRAESVRNYLIEAQGIAQTRLRAVGKGDSEVLNTKDIAAAENRRVTIVTITQ